MVWWYCLGSFIAGGLVGYLLLALYVRVIVKKDSVKSGKEIRQLVNGWQLNLFRVIKVLNLQRDKALRRAEAMDRSLQGISRKLGETAELLKSSQNRVASLEKQYSGLIGRMRNQDTSSNKQSTTPSAPSGKELNKVNCKNEPVSLFFTIPEADGSFYGEKGELVQDERKYFRISPVAGTDRGELFFISGSFDQKAIDNIDYYLFPVCEVENTSRRESASRIVQVVPGSVICSSGKWKVDKKVTVKLV